MCRMIHGFSKPVAIALLVAYLSSCSGGGGGNAAPVPPKATVASITVSGLNQALAPSTTAVLTAQALDTNGNPVSTAFSWISSDTTIATVAADGTVTAVAVGQAQISAAAQGVKGTFALVVNPSGSSEDLLAAAFNAGDITAEQALVYQVFALFGDPRLPTQFLATSDQPTNPHDLLMLQVTGQFGSLSTQAQSEIGPYLVPPAYRPTAATSTGQQLTPNHDALRQSNKERPFCVAALNPNWVPVNSTNFRVWYDAKAHAAWATQAAAYSKAAETALTTFTGMGFQLPLSDSSWYCDGGDGRLDIYLETLGDGINAQTTPVDDINKGSTSAAYIEIDPDKADSSTIPHELMHAIQYGYQKMGTDSYFWTLDAIAEWAQSQPPPSDHSHQVAFLYHSLRDADLPLFYPSTYCVTSPQGVVSRCDTQRPDSDGKGYSDYVFFQYLQQLGGAVAVSNFMTAAPYYGNSLDALSVTVTTDRNNLGDVWAEFSAKLWNQGPEDGSFPEWDGATQWQKAQHQIIGVGANGLPQQIQLPTLDASGMGQYTKVNELSAIYDDITIPDSVHSIVFYNGYSRRLTTKEFIFGEDVSDYGTANLDLGAYYTMYGATSDEQHGRRITALKHINGTWTEEDWTDVPYVAVCLDVASQRVDELVLIFSNGNYSTVRKDHFDTGALDSIGDQPSALVASATPCWQYQGAFKTTLSVDQDGDTFNISTSTTATYKGKAYDKTAGSSDDAPKVFFGWLFAADDSLSFNASTAGTLNSCSPGYKLTGNSDTFLNYVPGFLIWADPALSSSPSFYDGGDSTGGPGGALQFTVDSCNGGITKNLPAINPLNFNLSADGTTNPVHLTVDATTGKMASGDAGIQSAPWDNGDYNYDPNHLVVNTWCFIGIREGQTPAAGQCPSGTPSSVKQTNPHVKIRSVPQ